MSNKSSGLFNITFNVSFPNALTIFSAFFLPIPLNKPPVRNSIIESFSSGLHLSYEFT